MNQAIGRAAYEDRLRRVTDHIHEHLDEPLDLARLAEVACMSPYHWHRVYRAVMGETIAATVKRLRLHRAAGDGRWQKEFFPIPKRAPTLGCFHPGS